ncbi:MULTISPECIES: hypothetical protein [Desulfitobacterium]|uniref:Uncharacterized protein n=1 Tax=Desulfitobacterium dehalogenans (strain ATCC 51507 / DSM 9161 / JW/IU-DC1) TaxID=756499 RepID=I4A6W6_DESDJ|nr:MULTISPECIES: hypothetical protein [Desulfitobacterium]AFL99700.1 hypothetical protein Desde_1271 [Desulfitobacterium dehalogenans ATCC 51507]
MKSQKLTSDPVYQAILQTHTNSLKRYLSLAPTLKTPPQQNKNASNLNRYYQCVASHSRSFEKG